MTFSSEEDRIILDGPTIPCLKCGRLLYALPHNVDKLCATCCDIATNWGWRNHADKMRTMQEVPNHAWQTTWLVIVDMWVEAGCP